jgi:hypothetical protein
MLKRKYLGKLLQSLLDATGNEDSVISYLKQINVKDAAYWIAES